VTPEERDERVKLYHRQSTLGWPWWRVTWFILRAPHTHRELRFLRLAVFVYALTATALYAAQTRFPLAPARVCDCYDRAGDDGWQW